MIWRCLIILCAVGILVGSSFAPGFAGEAKSSDAVMTVTVSAVRPGALPEVLEVHGKAVPRDDVVVATDIGGVGILELFAEEGDTVEKGQKLAHLDTASLQFALDSLLADLARTEKEFARAKDLSRTNVISAETVGQREAAYLMMQAQVADARLRLEKAVVTAPAAGVIYQRDALVGAMTQADQPLFRMAARGAIELEVAVPEAFAHRIAAETPVTARLAGETVPQSAHVRVVSPRIDPMTRTAHVRLSFPGKFFIPVNTFCTASFSLPAREGLVVAATAVQQDTQGGYVWIVRDDNTVERQNVMIIARNRDTVLIEGVAENQLVVTRAGAFLQEGDRIRRAEEATQ